jgi:hypothetical protein
VHERMRPGSRNRSNLLQPASFGPAQSNQEAGAMRLDNKNYLAILIFVIRRGEALVTHISSVQFALY